ncbi:hypothetical protein Glaag_0413 [Glaciecola sp. 4H-3-7+YE-5]|uniref:hypothetical protein n=1 Tax=uncultured Alteromonas sp. TaxID=179113 RepID=UPI00020A73A4|nr:hypothetical protein Glaag_0413 [Glaciecola sp. 4H-3-7+YE-5]|tara:strand:- start:7534 stop:7902 length:369 start_codon:yes stop_codon:yes gene_type:complete
MDKNSKVAVTVAINTLLDRWGLTAPEKTAILGFASDADLNCFINSPSTLNFSPTLEQRLSLILNIHAELRLIFSNPMNVYGFMTMINNNSPFLGMKPIELASQSLEGLSSVNHAISFIGSGH